MHIQIDKLRACDVLLLKSDAGCGRVHQIAAAIPNLQGLAALLKVQQLGDRNQS